MSIATTTMIRRATTADARAIAEVHVAAWRWAYRDLMPKAVLDNLSITDREAQWGEWLVDNDKPIWVASSASEIVGFIAAGKERETPEPHNLGEIYALYQIEKAHRTGVGRALVTTALRTLHERSFTECVLWALASNTEARGFYEHLGFTPDGATKKDDRFGDHLRYRVATSRLPL